MAPRLVLTCLMLSLASSGCAVLEKHGGAAAGVAGGLATASDLELLRTPYVAGALIAYAIYDPLAPTWAINAVRLDEERVRFDLQMKALVSGGEGEARQVFMRNVQSVAAQGGYAGFEVVRYEEGIESSRPFARRTASGEVRFARSRTWPDL